MSQSTSLIPLGQVAWTRQLLLAQHGLPFAEHLPADFVHRTFRGLGHCFRQRVFTPAVTLWTFLSQVFDPDHSCRQAVARLLAWRVAAGLRPCSPDTGAYCRARQRLPEAGLAELTRHTGGRLKDQAPTAWLWKGRQVKVVDGTGLSMPDTPANQRAYPQPTSIAAGVGFPLLRLVVAFSLATGSVLDAALGPFRGKGTGELSLYRTLCDLLQPGDVLLADRLYATFWDIARAQACGADVVLRLATGRRPIWFRGRGHSTANRRVCWRKPKRPSWMTAAEYAVMPEKLRLRAVRVDVRRRGFRTRRLVLVTTLRDAQAVTREDLAELYRRRWQAELNLRSLKQTLQMDILRGKTPGVVRKEVWAHLLVYNIVRTVMAQAAALAGLRPDAVSFAGALQTLNAFLPHLRAAATEAAALRLWVVLLAAIAADRVGQRPDRYEPRAVKRRPKNYSWLKEPRAQARQRLRKRAKRVGKKH
jgi:Transposase DDE domain